jgi:hypothetical protein
MLYVSIIAHLYVCNPSVYQNDSADELVRSEIVRSFFVGHDPPEQLRESAEIVANGINNIKGRRQNRIMPLLLFMAPEQCSYDK